MWPRIDARVVDQNVDPAQRGVSLVDKRGQLREFTDVGVNRYGLSAECLRLARHFPGSVGVVEVIDRHIRAFARKRDRNGTADPLLRAGDQCLCPLSCIVIPVVVG